MWSLLSYNFYDRPLPTTVAKLVDCYDDSVVSIQDLSPASPHLSAPQYSSLSESGSSEETHCSEDITSSSSDITSGNYCYTSGTSGLECASPTYKISDGLHFTLCLHMTPQIPTTQSMASPASISSPPSVSSHPSTLLLDYAPTPFTPYPLVPSPYSLLHHLSPPSASSSPASAHLNQPIPVLPPWDGFKLVGGNIDKKIHPLDQRVHCQTQSLHYFHLYASEG